MSELTERYVGATLRSIPTRQRGDIEAELRASIEDAVEARLGNGENEAEAEKQVLTELGDPDRLASEYTGSPRYLVGPEHFFAYRRLLTVLLVTVIPVMIAVTAVGQVISGADVGRLITQTFGTALTLSVHIVFWTTLVFYLIGRSDEPSGTEWSLSDLPSLPTKGSITLSDTIWGVVVLVIMMALIILASDVSPVTGLDGRMIPMFNPAMWDFWFPYLITVLGLEIVFEVVKYRVGSWTWGLASMNLAFNVLFAVPAVYLLATDQIFNPDFIAEVPDELLSLNTVVIAVIVVIVVIDVVQAFRKAYLRC